MILVLFLLHFTPYFVNSVIEGVFFQTFVGQSCKGDAYLLGFNPLDLCLMDYLKVVRHNKSSIQYIGYSEENCKTEDYHEYQILGVCNPHPADQTSMIPIVLKEDVALERFKKFAAWCVDKKKPTVEVGTTLFYDKLTDPKCSKESNGIYSVCEPQLECIEEYCRIYDEKNLMTIKCGKF